MANSTEITDLNDDCLEHIFKKLNFVDLVNVAHTCKRFKWPVELAYASKYGKTNVTIKYWKCDKNKLYEEGVWDHGWYGNKVYDLLFALRLLRCFGQFIPELTVDYLSSGPEKHLDCLDEYVNEYCADSLKKIQLKHAPEKAMNHLKQPFAIVESVSFHFGRLENSIIDFNKWFPRMQTLNFWDSYPVNTSCIQHHFPNLDDLSLCSYFENDTFNRTNIIEVLRLNPQLKRLCLRGELVNVAFIQSISEYLQSIDTLSIGCNQNFFETIDGVIHFQNVTNFTLHIGYMRTMPALPFAFDKLESLTLFGESLRLNADFLNFIQQTQSLKKVEVSIRDNDAKDPFKKVNKHSIATAMARLTDIDLRDTVLSVDAVIEFLRICTFTIHDS